MRRSVAVVSDGSGGSQATGDHLDIEAAALLAGDAAVIEGRSGVRAVPIIVATTDADELASRIQHLPGDIAAVFLTRTEPERASAAQHRLAQLGGRPVLTEQDAVAIALTAAALSYLRRIGREPGESWILIVGASRLPILSSLLLGAGIHDVSLWNRSDEQWFPLRRAVRDADVVLDLLGATALDELAADRPDGSVIPVAGIDARTVATPGILRALTSYAPGAVTLDIDRYCDYALAVAAATPTRGYRPTLLCDSRIADAVAAAVHQSAVDKLDFPHSPGPVPRPPRRRPRLP